MNIPNSIIKTFCVVMLFYSVNGYGGSISYNYGGTITSIDDPDGLLDPQNISPTITSFSGSFTYLSDPLLNLEPSDPADVRYDLTFFDLKIDGHDFFTAPGGTMGLNDNTHSWGDLINIIGDRNSAVLNNSNVDLVLPQLMFSDFSRTIYANGIAMPLPLSLTDFDPAELVFQAAKSGHRTAWVWGAVTSITPVPVPATFWLFLAGFISFKSLNRTHQARRLC